MDIKELRDNIKHRAMIKRVVNKEIDNVLNKLVCLDDQTKERLFWLGG